jgi:hypothetical protein
MRYIYHDSGEAGELHNGQVLGDDSPVEFDEEGRAGPLEDDVAGMLSAMHAHVELGERAREDIESGDEDAGDGDFDAEAFVDRTPVSDVVDDLETGEYDDRLDEILEAEQRGRNRKSVQSAVEERR